VPPLEIEGGPLRPIEYRVPSNSAQVASCVLFAGLYAPGTTTVYIQGARDHTDRMLPAFGAPVRREAEARSVTGPVELHGASLRVPGDFSAAAFFLAAAAALPGTSVTAKGVSLNPTRTGLLRALESMGADIVVEETGLEAGEPVGNVTVTGPAVLRGASIAARDLPSMIDEIPALAIAAARAHGTSHIAGAGELRVKESDRLAALATHLRQLGVVAEEQGDDLFIQGGALRGGNVDADGDHRIAMAFAVAGLLADSPVTVSGASEIATSFPGFVAALRDLGGEVDLPEEDLLAR
jgi:3-phosphoshikimate 1-carboxyvinyltransferase